MMVFNTCHPAGAVHLPMVSYEGKQAKVQVHTPQDNATPRRRRKPQIT
jgi:hypothetical protein